MFKFKHNFNTSWVKCKQKVNIIPQGATWGSDVRASDLKSSIPKAL